MGVPLLERSFDLRPNARIAFAAAWIAGQIALVATAGTRPGATFGFRMFSESTTINAVMTRSIDAPSGHGTVVVPVEHGSWNARDKDGTLHRIKWRDRIRAPGLTAFDHTMHASYGADAQRSRWQAALDDFTGHLTAEDAETREVEIDLTLRKNGHEPIVIHLTSTPH